MVMRRARGLEFSLVRGELRVRGKYSPGLTGYEGRRWFFFNPLLSFRVPRQSGIVLEVNALKLFGGVAGLINVG